MNKNKLVLLLFAGVVFLYTSCTNSSKQTKEQIQTKETTKLSDDEIIVRGEYLVTIMGCHDCHSPKEMGPNGPRLIPELMLSGYPADRPLVDFKDPLLKQGFAMFYPDLTAAAGPWGVSFAGNLTPDATGIGSWTEDQFRKAMKEAKFKGLDNTRKLLPPMPSENYKFVTDEDIRAIYLYLRSIPAVKNVVPAPIPPHEI